METPPKIDSPVESVVTDLQQHPTFDADGYPTEETCKVISEWRIESGYGSLLEYARKAWRYPDYWREEDVICACSDRLKKLYHVSTAGWSGNESLVAAMQENKLFWFMCWVQSHRGGHYIFEVVK
jgi:hypothetical protein